ncbi:MAG: hypothetical protein IKT93_04300 [Clostridia bacterium]|nr:hypothetical protein [Clostridia bacterium]
MKFNFKEYVKQIDSFLLESDDEQIIEDDTGDENERSERSDTDTQEGVVKNEDEKPEQAPKTPDQVPQQTPEQVSSVRPEAETAEQPAANTTKSGNGMKAWKNLKAIYTNLEKVLNEAGIQSLAEALNFAPSESQIANKAGKPAAPSATTSGDSGGGVPPSAPSTEDAGAPQNM